MRRRVSAVWIVAGALAAFTAGPVMDAQAAASGQKQAEQQSSQDKKSKQSAQPGNNSHPGDAQKPSAPAQDNANPFPEDLKSVPVMPAANAPDLSGEVNDAHAAAPPVDKDPVRSPEDMAPGGSESTEGFSSSRSGLANLTAPPDEPERNGKKGDDSVIDTFPRETPEKDMDVGNYYMDNKDWKGALSRFQSALVLAPDNPDVYWGLAECQRHLGQYAQARENYLKVMEYDPGSHHAKDAKKALRDPEIANAKSK